MSRSYRMQLEISPVSEKDARQIRLVAEEHFDSVDGGLATGDYLSVWGDVTLGGGRTPEEFHNVIKADFKKLKKRINTRWLCWDNHPWDEEFEGFKEGG
jgi:hypothetical protein